MVNRFHLLGSNQLLMAARGRVLRRIPRNVQEIVCCNGLVMSAEGARKRTYSIRASFWHPCTKQFPRPLTPYPPTSGFSISSLVLHLRGKAQHNSIIRTMLEATQVSGKSSSLGVSCIREVCCLSVNGIK